MFNNSRFNKNISSWNLNNVVSVQYMLNNSNIDKISFKIKNGVNYKPDIWHFTLISTKNMNFLVIDRKGVGNNLVIHKFKKEKILLKK